MKWIGGQGRRPLSWATLIKVLKDVQLSELAREIEHNLSVESLDHCILP